MTGSSAIEPLFRAKHHSPRAPSDPDNVMIGGLRRRIDMGAQRHHVVGDPRPEDGQAALLDEFVERPLNGPVRTVGQADHVALDKLDRPVDQTRGLRFVEDQRQRSTVSLSVSPFVG